MKRILFALIILVLIASVLQAQAASVPHLINYQGMLTNAQGDPLETSEYKLAFKIFQQAAVEPGEVAIWGPQVFEQVPVVRGHFNVILGPKDVTDRDITAAFASENTYLEITVGDGAAITPRQQILSAPYAVSALHGVPAGTIVAYWGTTAPQGWLICNGGAIPAGTEFDVLRAMIGPNAPDLRGMFLRGANLGRSDTWRDPENRGIGHLQIDATKMPVNPFTTVKTGNHRHELVGWRYRDRRDDPGNFGHLEARPGDDRHYTGYDGEHSHVITGGDSETRPKNVCVNWIIKY